MVYFHSKLNFILYVCICVLYAKSETTNLCALRNSTTVTYTAYENEKILHSFEIYLSKEATSLYCFSANTKVVAILNITKKSGSILKSENVTLTFTTRRLGGANIRCKCDSKGQSEAFDVITFIVERAITIQEIIFRVVILIFVILITFVMGCSIEMKIVLEYMKKPIAPMIGLLSQFLIMPLVAFGISKLVGLSNEFAFGLVTVGCCPGGSGSNIWTVLLKGDLNLSMTMTFISTILALAMMPFWMFCLGRFFLDYKVISIPYLYILFNLFQVVIPAIIGVWFRSKWETKALKLIKLTKILALGFISFLILFGIYANLYMYILIFDYPYLIPIAAMLPWLGFLFGYITGIICRQGITKSLTISIEVGFQNIGIAILILKFSMPKPLGDMAAIVPIIVAIVTPFPLILGYIVDLIIGRCRKKSKKKSNDVSLLDMPDGPNRLTNIDKKITKQSVIEPTMYYCEELSSYFDESSPSLG